MGQSSQKVFAQDATLKDKGARTKPAPSGAEGSVRATQDTMVTLSSSPYQYRRRLPHLQKSDCPIFVSFRKLNREPFPPSARDLILQHCLHDHGKTMILHAAVVMPEHVHLLMTPLRDCLGWPIPLSKILRLIKGTSARSVNQLLKQEGPVWQEESFDHVLRSHEGFENAVDYIRQNPVRRGLIRESDKYPWLWLGPGPV